MSEFTKTLQVLLIPPEQHEELERLAVSRGLSTSTVAREAIHRLVRPEAATALSQGSPTGPGLPDLPLTLSPAGRVAVSVSRCVKLGGQLARETVTRNG
ncbi:hypothetical protein ACVWWN_006605 [Mycobacterium sp. URHB0021]|jgi:hypothetical protein